MNRKLIDTAADCYAANARPSCTNGDFDAIAIAKAFGHGAQWRINAAWHDGTASCQPQRKALVLFKNGCAAVYNNLRDLSYERAWGEVDKFAYLADLIPEAGKEASL